mmetsp:Transcript_45497/g.141017  ORF Transcript_45497/g.141017 Transcript_45497/m.141017 type:complete len:153 (+) Transcript_45497:447-905(+)
MGRVHTRTFSCLSTAGRASTSLRPKRIQLRRNAGRAPSAEKLPLPTEKLPLTPERSSSGSMPCQEEALQRRGEDAQRQGRLQRSFQRPPQNGASSMPCQEEALPWCSAGGGVSGPARCMVGTDGHTSEAAGHRARLSCSQVEGKRKPVKRKK